jgi:hypothetical protein
MALALAQLLALGKTSADAPLSTAASIRSVTIPRSPPGSRVSAGSRKHAASLAGADTVLPPFVQALPASTGHMLPIPISLGRCRDASRVI